MLPNIKSQEEKAVTYDISFDMKTLVYHTYRFTENVSVTRVFEDSTINKYTKSVTYWFTAFIPGDKDENGFLKVEVSTDSMKYQFNSPKKNIDYSTQNFDQPLPISDIGFLNSFLSNNQKFFFIYSSYGDVAKIDGERLQKEREIHSKIKDVEKRDFLLNALSDNTLEFKFDVTKGVYPTFQVNKDTNWISNANLFVNNIPQNGKIVNTFEGFKNNEYKIKSSIDNLNLDKPIEKYYFPDIDTYGTVESAVSTGEKTTEMFTGGTVKYKKGSLKSLVEGKVKNLRYKEVVKSDYTWDLLKRFSY